MFYTTAAIIGTNLYDFLIKILGSGVMRTLFSYLIRLTLTRIGI
jgi:hypothetical protein